MSSRSRRTHSKSAHRWRLLILAIGVFAGWWRFHRDHAPQPAGVPPWPQVRLGPQDRVLILAPHPDDEVLGCGGIIQQAVAMRLPLRIVFLTYGDNNQWSFLLYRKHPVLKPGAVRQMGLLRRDEALAASRVLGVKADQLTFLGYPDFGTLRMWDAHWADEPPFESMLTQARAVPYANALRPGAPYKGEEVVRDLTTVLTQFRPTKVFVSHPADHMPDHLACYLFTRVALWDLEPALAPELYPYLVHFPRWPKPRGDQHRRRLEPPTMLREPVSWIEHRLGPEEVERKQRAIRAHRTQYLYSANMLLAFARPNELFGDFPSLRLGPMTRETIDRALHEESSVEPPEELTEVERAAFVGLEARSIQIEADRVVVTLTFSRPLAGTVGVSVFLFGYRPDRPFEEMPKLHVKLGALTHAAYDQHRRLPHEAIQVTRGPKEITLRVPLAALGAPRRLLTSARTYLGDVPLDWISWRVVEIAQGS